MKIIYISLGVIATLLIGGLLIYNHNDSSTGAEAASAELSTLSESTKLYDVRTAEEFAAGHAEGAILLPLSDIEEGKFPEIDKNLPIAVYCRSGNRSTQAKQLLTDAGFTEVQDLGGLADLQKFNIKVVE